MSETQKFNGRFQLRPRLENENDKEYFERVTKVKWQVFDYEPRNIKEAIMDNDLTYYDAKRGNKGYLFLNNSLYEITEIRECDIYNDFCNLNRVNEDTYKFEAQFYNGGCSLDEIIEEAFAVMYNEDN